MPTYTCTSPAGGLDPDRRAGLAAAITLAHSEVTGAAAGFAQVVFCDVAVGGFFVGGRPLDGSTLFIRGEIRAGRSARERDRLVARLIADAAEASGLPRHAIWIYIAELPARCMAEFGHVLPEPGDEEAWIAALPGEARARIAGGRPSE
ncbi:tautomerase family protein [Methylobacterium haplocladii]|uniref:4-oxalocrotonate tautomerase n=1 Tax=Methylobacterium haplocladii TaxID=1176176 RepID=A0A512ITV5_9HYPH|nr:tautomerase family protein [Methylobacterium haplocladii]GEP01137.1 4-oxalocrotonate tautomerase [Methylobacterium haplocladii]GJD82903.1 hypothetical protein HPGCJGGD_0765 [Methylobacterium haplocladii]GLS61547.1 4-oxalocrotonate tautomerase [Methylobacterium haplocladii]